MALTLCTHCAGESTCVSTAASTLRLLLALLFSIKTHASTPANIPAAASIPRASLAGAPSWLELYTTSSVCLLFGESFVLGHGVLAMAQQ